MSAGVRLKATRHAISACRPLIGIIQDHYGLPHGFWDNEFVLGFFHFMIGFHLTNAPGEPLSTEDKGIAQFDSFTTLSGRNGNSLAMRCHALSTQSPQNELFECGANNAAMIAVYVFGELKRDQRTAPWLDRAEQMSAASGEPIGTSLMLLLYVQPIRKLFFSKVA